MSRYSGLTLAILTTFCVSAAFAQQQNPAPAPAVSEPSATNTADPDAKPPLTEEELRQQRIRSVDPLDTTDAPISDIGPPTQRVASPSTAKPLPGSVAAATQRPAARQQGPEVVSDDPTAVAPDQYTGPAVLSRSYTINRPSVSEHLKWTPTLSASSIYDTGLTGSVVQPDGTLPGANSMGTRVGWGISGEHLWRHDKLSLEYRGDANHYTGVSGYNGSNHMLSLSMQHVLSRHLIVTLSETASSMSQSSTLNNPALGIEGSVANVNLQASPLVQILDNGLKQSSTNLSMVWQKSARLSFNIGGGYFGVVRNGVGLFGNSGYTSNADINYRYSRRLTVGTYYSFSDFVFSQRIQVANTNTIGLIASFAFSRSLELRLRFGGTRIESQGLTTVAIDPAIAALLGQTQGIVEAYSRHNTSDISAEIAKDFGRTHTAKISYARGVSPGNGVQLTSLQESTTAGFSSPITRRNKLEIGAGRSSLNSAGQSIGSYTTNFASIGVSHQYARGIAQDFRVYYRTFDITTTPVNHPQISFSMGFSWSPGENPIHF